jgi:very-short-patch-repair endonuclease
MLLPVLRGVPEAGDSAWKTGFTVLRFSDHEVLKGMTGVISFLEEWIEK